MKELNNASIYGSQIDTITSDDKFNITRTIHEYKRATIHGSIIANELFLIDDTDKGIYASRRGWMICDLKPDKSVHTVDITTGQTINEIKSYRTSNTISLEEYCKEHQQEVHEWLNDHINITEYNNSLTVKQKINEADSNYEYEINFSKPKQFTFYVEDKSRTKDYLNIECSEGYFSIKSKSISLGAPDKSILQSVIRYAFLNRNLFDDLKKLDNGYVFNNKYYEKIDDIFSDIEWALRHDQKLNDKFMADGLTLDDLRKEK